MVEYTKEFRRINKPIQLSELAYRVCRPIMQKKGRVFADLYICWPEIVGEYYSKISWPHKITPLDGMTESLVLYLEVSAAAIMEVQYNVQTLAGKINDFFGKQIVKSIKILRTANGD